MIVHVAAIQFSDSLEDSNYMLCGLLWEPSNQLEYVFRLAALEVLSHGDVACPECVAMAPLYVLRKEL